MSPSVKAFFDEATFTVTYVVADPSSSACAIIDSVLDFDERSGRTSTASADAVIEFVRSNDLTVDWIVETHEHADHITAAPYIKETLGGTIAISDGVVEVQKVFGRLFNAEPGFATDGSQFDHLLKDGETFTIGALQGTALHSPGHTPACVCYHIGDAAFVGDTLFMPDSGTARTDFPGGSAARLYASLNRILSLAPETKLFICHDYGAGGKRSFAWETTVAEQKAENIHVKDGTGKADYIHMREARDATLAMPRLILPSVQVNMRAGHFPPPDDNGTRYLKLPVDVL